MEQPTIREIAEAVGLSTATVSRALRRHHSVTKERTEQVFAAAQKLGYQPVRNRATKPAQPLRHKTIALVLLGMDRSLVSLPVVAAAIHGAQASLAEAGARVLFADFPTLRESPDILLDSRLDGLILKGAMQGQGIGLGKSRLLQFLRSLPSVWMLGRPLGAWGDAVNTNDFSAGVQAARILSNYGHRTLAILNPKPDHVAMKERELGFTLTAQQAGAEVLRYVGKPFDDRKFPLHAVERIDDVHDLLEPMLNSKTRPTAVFTPADSIAALVYRDLTSRGLQVGRDLSLISCNGESSLSAGLYPTLTTYDIHAELIGRRAVSQLIWRLSEGEQTQNTDVAIAPTLVPGASVLPPAKQRS